MYQQKSWRFKTFYFYFELVFEQFLIKIDGTFFEQFLIKIDGTFFEQFLIKTNSHSSEYK